jgi:hypothetical protein
MVLIVKNIAPPYRSCSIRGASLHHFFTVHLGASRSKYRLDLFFGSVTLVICILCTNEIVLFWLIYPNTMV